MTNTAISPPPSNATSPTILLVDDNPSGAQTLQMILTLEGYNVVIASTGCEAIEAFTTHDPEVVLLDISLPDTDGYTIAKKMRDMDSDRQVLIIAVTGWGEDHDVRQALAAGCDHHFTKPIRFEDLSSALLRVKPREREPSS